MACIARQAWHEGPQESSPAFQGSQGSNIKAPVFTLETCYNVMELKRGRYVVTSSLRCKRPSLGRAQRDLIGAAAAQRHLVRCIHSFMTRTR